MKILNLTQQEQIYTSNVYLITGDWNTIEDMNTLVDVGRDPAILERIEAASTGVGKKRIAQVVLTHNHYDHTGLLPEIKKRYTPKIFAYSNEIDGVDKTVRGGDILKMGDALFEVIHVPGHSNDSICLYCKEEKVLFAGDTPLVILTRDKTYAKEFVEAIRYISIKPLERIYFGHGPPIQSDVQKILQLTLYNIQDVEK